MTRKQRRLLVAAVPAGLAIPGFLMRRTAEEVELRGRWDDLPSLDRFVLTRLFGRSEQRALVEPAMMLLRQWGVPMRDVLERMTDAVAYAMARDKLRYGNRHGT